MAAVRCKCSHAKSQHTRGEGQCWATVCGCRTYRPDEKPTPEPQDSTTQPTAA